MVKKFLKAYLKPELIIMVLNPNRLAVLLAVAMLLSGAGIFYWFQKHLFERYRRRIPNSVGKTKGNKR